MSEATDRMHEVAGWLRTEEAALEAGTAKIAASRLAELRESTTAHALVAIAEHLETLTAHTVSRGEHAAKEAEADAEVEADKALGAPGDPEVDKAADEAETQPADEGGPVDDHDQVAKPSGRRAASGPAPEVLTDVSGTKG